jgi:hypothetical protein
LSQESRDEVDVWLKRLRQPHDTCVEFFTVMWILGVTALDYAFGVSENIVINACKYFVSIMTVLCWNTTILTNKCPLKMETSPCSFCWCLTFWLTKLLWPCQ